MSFDLQCVGCGLIGSGVHRTPTTDALCGDCFEARYPAGSVETQSSVTGIVEGVPGANPLGTLAPGTLRRCDLRAMLDVEPEPVDWLAEGVVARGYLSLLVGREKTGKSLLALALSARCAEGGGTIAGINCAPARVLYVDCENGSREIHRRIRALGLSSPDKIEVFEASGSTSPTTCTSWTACSRRSSRTCSGSTRGGRCGPATRTRRRRQAPCSTRCAS